MSDLPQGFYSGDLYCFPVGPASAGRFAYIPGPPHVEIQQGTTKAVLESSLKAGILSLQVVWEAEPQAVAAAEAELLKQHPNASSTLQLKAAEFTDASATLVVKDTNGGQYTVGPQPSSGYPSNRAVLQGTLKETEKLAAISAFHGKTGVIDIRYDATLSLAEAATAELTGDLALALKALAPKPPAPKSGGFFGKKKEPEPPAPPDLAACSAAVDHALSTGTLKITRTDTPNASEAARQKTEATLRKTAAKLLFDKLVQMGADAAYMSKFAVQQKTTEPEQVSYHISRSADPASWLAQHGGGRLVGEVGAPLTEPER